MSSRSAVLGEWILIVAGLAGLTVAVLGGRMLSWLGIAAVGVIALAVIWVVLDGVPEPELIQLVILAALARTHPRRVIARALAPFLGELVVASVSLFLVAVAALAVLFLIDRWAEPRPTAGKPVAN